MADGIFSILIGSPIISWNPASVYHTGPASDSFCVILVGICLWWMIGQEINPAVTFLSMMAYTSGLPPVLLQVRIITRAIPYHWGFVMFTRMSGIFSIPGTVNSFRFVGNATIEAQSFGHSVPERMRTKRSAWRRRPIGRNCALNSCSLDLLLNCFDML